MNMHIICIKCSLVSYVCVWYHMFVYIYMLYCHLQHHNDTIIKTQEDFFMNIFVPLTLFVRVRKGY